MFHHLLGRYHHLLGDHRQGHLPFFALHFVALVPVSFDTISTNEFCQFFLLIRGSVGSRIIISPSKLYSMHLQTNSFVVHFCPGSDGFTVLNPKP